MDRVEPGPGPDSPALVTLDGNLTVSSVVFSVSDSEFQKHKESVITSVVASD